MRRETLPLGIIILLALMPQTMMQIPVQAKWSSEAIVSDLPASPLVPDEWFEYWTNNSGGDGGNLLYKITTNTNNTWSEVEVWNQTTSSLNQTAYVKKVSGEGGHQHCYAVEDYAVYTSFGTSHPYQWDRWFDLEGVSVGSTIGPIESEEGESFELRVNATEIISTQAGTFECWLANASQFEMGFWFYTNYWIDKDSNITVKATIEVPAFGYTFVDELVEASWLTPPVISNVASEAQRFTAEVTWTTDETADSTVHYGLSMENLNLSAYSSEFIQSHSVTLLDLLPLTTYYFEVESFDIWGSGAKDNNSGLFYFFTTLSADAPEILNLFVTATSNSTIELTFDTDKLTNATVWYSLTPLVTTSLTDPIFSTHHELEMTGLEELTVYYYKIGISDSLGNKANSSLRHISTMDQTAPKIVSFSGYVLRDTLNVTLETNEESFVDLYVGQNSTYLSLVDRVTIAQVQHSVIANNLPSYSTVYFRLLLSDPYGNIRWYQNGTNPFTQSVPDYLIPEINHPDDIFVLDGEVLPDIIWAVSDQTLKSYEIRVDGESLGVVLWNQDEITLSLENLGLEVGTYSIELRVKDRFGNVATDVVIVTREQRTSLPQEIFQWVFLGAALLLGFMVTVSVIILRRGR